MKMHPETHLDHGLTQAQIDYLFGLFETRTAFFVETVTLPEELGTVPCALHFDVPESEVHYARRGDRGYDSRLCKRPTRQVREVTVVAGPVGGDEVFLFTAYGGPEAPREPTDPGCKDVEAARAFWSTAALSSG